MRLLLAGALLAGLAACGLAAGIPAQLSFQGRLQEGSAPASGVVSLTVRLYDVAFDGTPLTTEAFGAVPDGEGVFHTTLAAATTLDGALLDRQLYAGVTVEPGVEQFWRLPLTPVPYAVASAYADRGPTRVIHVGHLGDDVRSGSALKAVVDAARASQTSGLPGYLIDVGPGRYTLGSSFTDVIELGPNMTLQGAGPEATVIANTGFWVVNMGGATQHSELRRLTVENLPGSQTAQYGVYLESRGALMHQVRIRVVAAPTATTARGLSMAGICANFRAEEVEIEMVGVSTTASLYGIAGGAPASPITILRSRLDLTGVASDMTGVYWNGGALNEAILDATEMSVVNQDSRTTRGVAVTGSGVITLHHCDVRASAPGGTVYSLDQGSSGGAIRVAHSLIDGTASSGVCGVHNLGASFGATGVSTCP